MFLSRFSAASDFYQHTYPRQCVRWRSRASRFSVTIFHHLISSIFFFHHSRDLVSHYCKIGIGATRGSEWISHRRSLSSINNHLPSPIHHHRLSSAPFDLRYQDVASESRRLPPHCRTPQAPVDHMRLADHRPTTQTFASKSRHFPHLLDS